MCIRSKKPAKSKPATNSDSLPNQNPASESATHSDFYGRDFLITPDVLIPRAETEQLIDLALALAGKPYLPGMLPPKRQLPKNPTILDIGTGSGCIAITLALEVPQATVLASDVSLPALAVAQHNCQKHSLDLPLINSDLFQSISFQQTVANLPKSPYYYGPAPGANPKNAAFSKIAIPTPDLVVANLPYVDKSWSWVDTEALAAEPDLALYAEDGGLALIKELIEQCRDRQIPRLLLEADPSEHQQITDFAADHHYILDRIMGFALSLHREN